MGALIGIGALIDKNQSKGGVYSEEGAYLKEGAKSNHYGKSKRLSIAVYILTCSTYQLSFVLSLGPHS